MKTITINTLNELKRGGEKFPVITAYDSTFARLAEQAGIEVLLVGDSLGNVMLGYSSTVPVSMADMVHHTAAVCRGSAKSFVIADLPFMAYATAEQAMTNGAALMQAGSRVAARVTASIDAIPDDDPTDIARLFVAHSGCLRHAAVVLGAIDVRHVAGLSMDSLGCVLLEKKPNGEWIHLAGEFEKHVPGR